MRNVNINWKAGSLPWEAIYQSDSPVFAWAKYEKGKFFQTSAWHSCRETFASELCIWYRTKEKGNVKSDPRLRKLRALTGYRLPGKIAKEKLMPADLKKYDKAASLGLSLVNIVEKYLGWPLSTVKTVDRAKTTAVRVACYMFTGSVKWLRSPQLVSLYMLLVRLGHRSGSFGRVKTLKGILNAVGKFNGNQEPSVRVRKDMCHLAALAPYIRTILDNSNELFFSESAKEHFEANTGANGINRLISCKCTGEVNKRWKKMKLEMEAAKSAK